MKIVVCLKQVPARDAILRLNSSGTWIQESEVHYEVNEPDIYALEEALRLKETAAGSGHEVVVCTVGPEQADLILTGLQSDDFGFAQTGVILAEMLGMPHSTIIMKIQIKDGTAEV